MRRLLPAMTRTSSLHREGPFPRSAARWWREVIAAPYVLDIADFQQLVVEAPRPHDQPEVAIAPLRQVTRLRRAGAEQIYFRGVFGDGWEHDVTWSVTLATTDTAGTETIGDLIELDPDANRDVVRLPARADGMVHHAVSYKTAPKRYTRERMAFGGLVPVTDGAVVRLHHTAKSWLATEPALVVAEVGAGSRVQAETALVRLLEVVLADIRPS